MVSELSWDFIEDYKIFSFTLKDLKVVRFRERVTPEGENSILEMGTVDIEHDPIEVPKTFDVTWNGDYMGMPRLKEYLVQVYDKMRIDFNKLSLAQRQAMCTQIDSQMKNFWQGLQGNWLRYKKACIDDIPLNKEYTMLCTDISAKGFTLDNEVETIQLIKSVDDDALEMRKFYDKRLNDELYRASLLRKSQVFSNISQIVDLEYRNDLYNRMGLEPNEELPAYKLHDTTKYFELYKNT